MIRIKKDTKRITISNDCQFSESEIKLEVQSSMKLSSKTYDLKITFNDRYYYFDWNIKLDKGQHEFIITQEGIDLTQRELVFVEFDELDDIKYTPKQKTTKIYKRK